jgi:hypothetical protein
MSDLRGGQEVLCSFNLTHLLVVPENSARIEIIELVSIGFSGYVRDVAVIPQILLRVFPKSG